MHPKEVIRNLSRAERRKMHKFAGETARMIAEAGLGEIVDGGRAVERVHSPAAIEFMKGVFTRFIRGDCERRMELVDEKAAVGMPSAATRPKWAERCYITVDLDDEGRITWSTIWAAGNDPQFERECAKNRNEPELDRWCRTKGFGDPKARGRA